MNDKTETPEAEQATDVAATPEQAGDDPGRGAAGTDGGAAPADPNTPDPLPEPALEGIATQQVRIRVGKRSKNVILRRFTPGARDYSEAVKRLQPRTTYELELAEGDTLVLQALGEEAIAFDESEHREADGKN